MEISSIKKAVRDAVSRGKIDHQEAEAALSRIERAEARQWEIQNDPDATEAQKVHSLDELNAASEEARDLLERI